MSGSLMCIRTNDLSYTENFMKHAVEDGGAQVRGPARRLGCAQLDILFILHADHEQNCSTNAMRSVSSSQADPYLSVASAASALGRALYMAAPNEESFENARRDRVERSRSGLHQAR